MLSKDTVWIVVAVIAFILTLFRQAIHFRPGRRKMYQALCACFRKTRDAYDTRMKATQKPHQSLLPLFLFL